MKNLQKKLRFLSLVLIAGLLFFNMTLTAEAYIQKMGTVNETVTLRQNADSNSGQLMKLESGQKVKVNNEISGTDGSKWYQLIVDETNMGYVPASTVTITGNSVATQGSTTQTVQTVTITERIGTVTAGSAIRVRQEATTASEQIASMEPQDTFLVLEDVDASDGYVWHKVEFDDNGKVVVGYVRSDLVKVKEVTREEQQIVDVPAETPPTETVDAPYSVNSKVNAEGTTVWYLTDNATGEAKEISSLLDAEPAETKGNGVYKIIVVILLILVILAAGAATFFYMRWRDAEEFISEMREKQARAKRQSVPNRPVQTAPVHTKQFPQSKPVAASKPVAPAKESGAGNTGIGSVPKMNLPEGNIPARPSVSSSAQQPVKPVGQSVTQQPVKPVGQTISQQLMKTAQTQQAAQAKPINGTAERAEVLPHTVDIVKATQQELKNNASGSTTKQQSGGWKSKNFLTEDDDLEFDFLDMEDK